MPFEPSLDSPLDHLATGWRPWVLLTLLSLALFLPGMTTVPVIDRDEARYVEATRQMLDTRDFVRIRFQDEARNKKPVGIYWLQAASVAAFGDARGNAIWPYRLVSLVGATLAVLLTFAFGTAIFDRRPALLGAALLASTVDLVFEAHLATADAALLPAAVAAQGVLALAYLSARRGERLSAGIAACFWVAMGIGVLIKGPVVPGLSILTALALVIADRRGRWLLTLRPLWGVPLLVLIVAPWLILIEQQTGGAFLRDSLGHDFLGKLAGGQEAHGAPPGAYLLALPVSFWPASLFLGVAGVWAWRGRRLPATRLLAAWVVPFWIVLEIVPTKLPHYVLPLYPALALACGCAVAALGEGGMAQPARWLRPIFPWIWGIVGVAIGLAILAAPPVLKLDAMAAGAVPAAAAIVVAWQVLVHDRSRLGPGTVTIAVMASMLILVPAFQMVLPRLDPIWLSRSVARMIAFGTQGDVVAATGYAEPSLVFLLGQNTELLGPADAAAALTEGKVNLALVEDADDTEFRRALAGNGSPLVGLAEVDGLDYSNGKWLTLRLYRTTHKAPP